MNDDDPDERELAMFFNRILLSHCEAMWVHTPRVSAGMRIEIGPVRKLLTVCLCGRCPGRLV